MAWLSKFILIHTLSITVSCSTVRCGDYTHSNGNCWDRHNTLFGEEETTCDAITSTCCCTYNNCVNTGCNYCFANSTIQGLKGKTTDRWYSHSGGYPDTEKISRYSINEAFSSNYKYLSCNCLSKTSTIQECKVQIKTCFKLYSYSDVISIWYETWITDDYSKYTAHYCCAATRNDSVMMASQTWMDKSTTCVSTPTSKSSTSLNNEKESANINVFAIMIIVIIMVGICGVIYFWCNQKKRELNVCIDNENFYVPLMENSSNHANNLNQIQQCVICFEEYKPDDERQSLPCMHVFHAQCINDWIIRQRTCPICRTNIDQ